jgi:Mce-associated membrane protein
MTMTDDTVARPDDDPRRRAAAEARARLRAGESERPGEPAATPVRPEEHPTTPGQGATPPGEHSTTSARLATGSEEGATGPEGAGTPSAPGRRRDEARGTSAEQPSLSPSGEQGRRSVNKGLAVACVVLVVALALAVVAWRDAAGRAGRELAARQRLQASALSAARAYSVDLASYDYRDLSRATDLVLSHATASFRKSYTSSSSGLDTILRKYKASAVGTVEAVGLASLTPTRAVALVFVNQTVDNTEQKRTTDESRLEITLVRSHGQWLIDKVVLL